METPEEQLFIFLKRVLLFGFISLLFITTNLLYSIIGFNLSENYLNITNLSTPNTYFLSSVGRELGDQYSILSLCQLSFGIKTILILLCFAFLQGYTAVIMGSRWRALILKTNKADKNPSWAEFKKFFKKPETMEGILSIHRMRLVTWVVLGYSLDYFMWFFGEVECHVFSMKSLMDTLLFNPQFVPAGGLDVVRSGQSLVTLDLNIVTVINMGIIIASVLVSLLFLWSLSQFLFTARMPPEGSY